MVHLVHVHVYAYVYDLELGGDERLRREPRHELVNRAPCKPLQRLQVDLIRVGIRARVEGVGVGVGEGEGEV